MAPSHGSSKIEYLRKCGRINASIHNRIYEVLYPGVTTAEIDKLAGTLVKQAGAASSIIAAGFPGNICISVNEEVGHGVPGNYTLHKGDIVKVDIAIMYQGVHTDCAQTYIVQSGSDEFVDLLETGKASLWNGIVNARAGQRCSDISAAISKKIREHGYSAVRQAFGHGIGDKLHDAPSIANYGPAHLGQRLTAGMALAIEPVISAGSGYTDRKKNGWTDITSDGSMSAHFEHTVVITDGEPEVLTQTAENNLYTRD